MSRDSSAELCGSMPGYAILSHVWDTTEQTVQETQALRTAGDPEAGYNPRDHSSPKVREACIAAERDGYRWLWDDTCCIDKTSSSELSEAINSMFSYYAFAEVCYAYLADVPPGSPMVNTSVPSFPSYALQRSRWFKRGWTLQELIAPAHVIFLSSDWQVMGTKTDNAPVLASLTGIPRAILALEEEIWDMSIAERMSWALGDEPVVLRVTAYAAGRTEQVRIRLGRCKQSALNTGSGGGLHWVVIKFGSAQWPTRSHDCAKDHIVDWPTSSSRLTHSVRDPQSAGGGSKELVLSFVLHRPNPTKTAGPLDPVADPSAPSANDDLVRDTELWLESGSVVLLADNIAFKVNRQTLAVPSVFFQSLFQFPRDAAVLTIDGCPLVKVDDSPEDLRHLLRVLFHRPIAPGGARIAFPHASAYVRLSHKYKTNADTPPGLAAIRDTSRSYQFTPLMSFTSHTLPAPISYFRSPTSSAPASAEGSALVRGYEAEDGTHVTLGSENLERVLNLP
ncbi:heterokaryon incompatibility protein-domain-containing protein [Cerioporus squamosus]|nr:heterokaryon incompatibility protein-domain-containing protein [Cerioporus squamosus]